MKKSILALVVISIFIAMVLFMPGLTDAGKKPNPNEAMMNMLEDIYAVVWNTNSYVIPTKALVPKTGQTTCYDTGGTEIDCAGTGQDGEYQYGTLWPDPRFTDNGNGTVTDNLTELIWLKNANCFGNLDWYQALDASYDLEDDQCGLSDGSDPGDWHLPNVRELHSLIDFGNWNPALPSGHPFTGVPGGSNYYWSSTTSTNYPSYVWDVHLGLGIVLRSAKDATTFHYVWPVRDGN